MGAVQGFRSWRYVSGTAENNQFRALRLVNGCTRVFQQMARMFDESGHSSSNVSNFGLTKMLGLSFLVHSSSKVR